MTKENREFEIATTIGRNVADYIYMKCYERMWMNGCNCLKQIEQICQVPRPHLAAVEVSFDEACKDEQSAEPKAEMTAGQLVEKLREFSDLYSSWTLYAEDLLRHAEALIQKQGEKTEINSKDINRAIKRAEIEVQNSTKEKPGIQGFVRTDAWHSESFNKLHEFFELVEEKGLDRDLMHVAWITFLDEINSKLYSKHPQPIRGEDIRLQAISALLDRVEPEIKAKRKNTAGLGIMEVIFANIRAILNDPTPSKGKE